MKRFICILILAFTLHLLLFASPTVQAQGVTLEECRRLARENWPAVQQYELVAQSEQYSLSNASRAWIPQVRLSAQASWQSDAASFPDEMTVMLAATGLELEGMRQDQYKVAIDVQQNIWDGGRSTADRAMARAQADVDRLAAEVELYALEGRVDNLFFGILLLDAQIDQTEKRIALLEENLRRCRVMAEHGTLLQSDVDAVEVEVLTAGQSLEQLRHSVAAYREMLSLLTGKNLHSTPLAMPIETKPDLATGSHRPELRFYDAKASVLQSQEQLLRTTTMPQFSAFAQGWYGYPGLNMFENMKNADWSLNAIVGLRLSWNIAGYYTQDNRLQQLRIGQQQVRVQRDVFVFNNRLQRSQQNAEMNRLQRALRDDERIVALRRSVREASETKLANGTIGTSELLRAITDESTALSAQTLHEIELLKKQYEMGRL